MTVGSPDWEPKIGEMAWIPEELNIPREFKKEVPDSVTGHFPLILHITPGQDAKTRFVWFVVLHSTKGDSAREDLGIHFQYKYVDKQGVSADEHEPIKCGSNCRKLLFLEPYGGSTTRMNTKGYVDIQKVYELPLNCFRRRPGQRWQLRDCSIALIADHTRSLIADRVAQWQPRYEVHVLSQKLDLSYLQTDDLLCWVKPASKILVDSNGTTYTASGPCVVFANDLKKAKIHVLLDKRKSTRDSVRFSEIRADSKTSTAPVLAPHSCDKTRITRLALSLPRGDHRMWYMTQQYLVLEPSFEVSINDLYELPSCYLPVGARVCTMTVSCIDDFKFLEMANIDACAAARRARDAERNRLEAERAKAERQKIGGEEDHEQLLQKTETGLKKIKDIARGLLTAVGEERVKGIHDQAPDQVFNSLKWLENYLLVCAAMACLKQEGALLRAGDDEVKSPEQQRRSDLAAGIDEVLVGIDDCEPQIQSSAALREAIGPTASQCDLFIYSMNPTVWPTYETFIPKETALKDSVQATLKDADNTKDSSANALNTSPSCAIL